MPDGIGPAGERIIVVSITSESLFGPNGAHVPAAVATAVADVRSSGVGLLRGAFALADVDDARRVVLDNVALMKNTRPNPTSRHVAGFHRYPELEPLHHLLTGNRRVLAVVAALLGPDLRTIGLSDITINRSQQWHKDLLRGHYSRHLEVTDNCAKHHGKVVKVIMYLQDSSSLRFVPGSHLRDVPLDHDDRAIPAPDDLVTRLDVVCGDAVLIDVCTTHRGSSDEELEMVGAGDPPRILMSTVFGRVECEFTDRMEFGNAERLAEWQRRDR